MLATMAAVWLRSCLKDGHNMVDRGERELRGERRGQGGRLSATAVAPSFFILVLLAPGAAAAQGWGIEARAGVVVASTWAEDAVVAPGLETALGSAFTGAVEARPEPGFAVSVAAVGPLRDRTALELGVGWTRARVGIDDAGDRSLNSFQTLHALVGVRYRLSRALHAGAGVGALRTWGDDVALFERRAETSPLGEASLGVESTLGGTRVLLRGSMQVHRFTAAALEARGGEATWTARYTLSAGVALGRPAW